MNFRQTAILLGAVLAVGVVLLILTWTSGDKTPETDTLTEELAGVKPSEIDTVEFEREDGKKLKIVRTDADKKPAVWKIVEPFNAPADSAAVEGVIAALMTRAKPLTHPELSGNPAVHALDPPGLKITLRQGTDKASTVNFGNVSVGGSKGVVFVTTSKRSRPLAVQRSDLEVLFREPKGGVKAVEIAKWVNDYRQKAIFPGDSRTGGEDVASLKLSLPNRKGPPTVALTKSPGGVWTFDNPAGWGEADAEGDSNQNALNVFTGVNPIVRALTNLSASAPDDFLDATEEQKKQWGLTADNQNLVRAEVKLRDGQTTVVLIGNTEGAPKAEKSDLSATTGSKVYVSVEGQPGVIKAGTRNLSGLASVIADPKDLRNRDLLTLERGKQIEGLEIVVAGQTPDKPQTKLWRGDMHEWKLYGRPSGPQKAWSNAVTKIIDVLTAKRAIKDFSPPPNPENFKTISSTIYAYTEAPNPPADPKAAPTPKGPAVKFEFGRKEDRKDGAVVYVRRTLPSGQAMEFTVPAEVKIEARIGKSTETRDVLGCVVKTRLEMLDQSLPSFSDSSPTRIAVSGLNNYVLVKDVTADPIAGEPLWRFVEPAGQKGQIADAIAVKKLIDTLSTSQSVFGQFVDDEPDANALAVHNLNPPRLKVTIDFGSPAPPPMPGAPVPPGPKPIVFEFGKDADPDKVFARVAERPAVFTLQRRAFDLFVSPDLRDRMLFRFDTSKVTALELRGWRHLQAGEIKLRFEKNKDGVWSGTRGDNKEAFPTDPVKVGDFLKALTEMRAKTFLAGNAQKPEYGFGDNNYLIVIITRSDGPPINLNIGAATDNGASYFVVSDTLPSSDPFCTVEVGKLKPFKEAPSGFAVAK